MAHVLYARFDTPEEIDATVAELERIGMADRHCRVAIHRGSLERAPSSELPLFETGAARMIARLTAIGTALGAVVGLVAGLGPNAPVPAGPLTAMVLTTPFGAMAGLLMGILAGSSDVDPTLARLAKGLRAGQVLLSVEPPSADCAERAEHVLHKHHGRIVHRHLFRNLTDEERRELEDPRAP